MELILKAMLLAGALICAWAAYKVIHEYIIENRKGTPSEPEASYKLEASDNVAVPIPHKPVEWTFDNPPDNTYFRRDHFEPYCKPKRKYTKRSKYWTDKRKKAAARKARKSK